MTPALVLVTVAAYFTVLFAVAYVTGRKADNQGFFVGNRKSPWFVVAFAMIGSSISGVTFISVPGLGGDQPLFVYADGARVSDRAVDHRVRADPAVLPDAARIDLRIPRKPLRSLLLQNRGMVLLHLENARGGRADFPGLYRHATTGFRTARHRIRLERRRHDGARMALHVPRRRQIAEFGPIRSKRSAS